MRLKKEDIDIIKETAKDYFGVDVKVYLFGSRTDDKKRGGDIDLYIETGIKEKVYEKKMKMLAELHKILGEQKIDIVINNFGTKKFIYEVAKSEGIPL